MTNTELAQALAAGRTQRARIKVIMAAHPDNPIIQAFGRFMDGLWAKAMARHEAKRTTVH
jgi:hypothetical protein